MFLKVSACSHTCGIGFNGAAATRRLAALHSDTNFVALCCNLHSVLLARKSVCVFGNHDGISEKGIWQVHNRICRLHMTDDGAF